MEDALKSRDDLSVRVLVNDDIHDARVDVIAMQIKHLMANPHYLVRCPELAQCRFDAS
jgi:hypothetical protein